MPKSPNIPLVYFHFPGRRFSLLNRNKLKHFIAYLFKKEKKKISRLDYIFCSDNFLLEINRNYLRHDFYTDVITFDLSEEKNQITGEIYISTERIKENAHIYNTSFKQELHRVIFHGALHLCGYRDKTQSQSKEMRKMEEKYLVQFFKKPGCSTWNKK